MAFIGRRVVGLGAVALALVALTFVIVQLVPGDPARNIAGLSASPQQIAIVRDRLGLNDQVLLQAWHYLSGLVSGNWGASFVNDQSVLSLIAQRLPFTLSVAAGGLLFVLLLAFPAGMAMAVRETRNSGSSTSGAFNAVTGVLGAVPEYVTGTILVTVFAVQLQWVPVQGGQSVSGYLLPCIAVGLAPGAAFARIVRNETRSVLSQEYIATARSKRISTSRLLVFHALPNVATSTLTMGGILLVALLGGTVIVENLFTIPGLGTQIVQAILASDYPMIQGIILTLGLVAVVMNLLIDIVLAVLDPRVMSSGAAA
ncbi:ABC transporter permease [Rhodococcus ruber]|uniref:ABC transporter permease n=1 Tax=Rhodococcus ruber TaxID=1830 RepID=A0ABT4MRE4_9NOCA|nr:ABC transporter permease [Rhodococcus ruber]MCZ4522301.1 ABC transporter permease [Rhodococcus ruber]